MNRLESLSSQNGGVSMAVRAAVHRYLLNKNVSRIPKSISASSLEKKRFRMKIVPFVDLNNQTFIHSDGSRSLRPATGIPMDTVPYVHPDTRTVFDVFRRGMSVYGPNADCLGYRTELGDGSRPYVWMSFREVEERSLNLGAGLRQLGLKIGQTENIGIFMKNRPEWFIVDQATCAYSNVNVPLYETLGDKSIDFIMRQCEMKAIFCEDVLKATKILSHKPNLPHLETIIMVEGMTPEFRSLCEREGVHVVSMEEVERNGSKIRISTPIQPPKPSDVYTICYTSGTTSNPKGVILTHQNILSTLTLLNALPNLMGSYDAEKEQMTYLSFLPFAHVYDRVMQITVMNLGARIGFYNGDMKKLLDDMKELKPDMLSMVPRLLNRVYSAVMSKVHTSKVKTAIFNGALEYKKWKLERFGIVTNDSLADRIVFHQVQEVFGGNLRAMFTGSAPIHQNVLKFARGAMGCLVLEGYGMTETAIANTLTMEGDTKGFHVGPPFSGSRIKLVDAPECGFEVARNGGEICVKGNSVTPGYYKNPEETAEVIDQDGWLHTGDIGVWTPEGCLKIVDRKKNLFKLSQGEYVAPEKIENIYVRLPMIEQCYVHGDSTQTTLIAITVPDEEVFTAWCAKTLGISGSFSELCANEVIRAAVREELRKEGTKDGLHGFEQVSAVFLHPEQFSIENDLLTPTLKNKRRNIETRFRQEIDKIYEKVEDLRP